MEDASIESVEHGISLEDRPYGFAGFLQHRHRIGGKGKQATSNPLPQEKLADATEFYQILSVHMLLII